MRANQLESRRQQLFIETPWIGPWLRRRAIGVLAKTASPEAAQILAEFAAQCRNGHTRDFALETLRRTTAPSAIDRICAVWVADRNPVLANLITAQKWIALAPPTVRILTALKIGRPEVVREGNAEVVDPLVDACADADKEVAQRASECLRSLRNPVAIDALCARWMRRREPAVTAAVEQSGYVAQQPVPVRVVTALKAGKPDLITGGGPEIVEPLIDACKDPDPAISERAVGALRQLRETPTQEELCRWVSERDEPQARDAVIAAGYAPRDPLRRALFFFVTEQWDAYERLDFDHRLLACAFEAGSKKLRCRIAEKGRRAGRTEWLTGVVGSRHERRLSEMTDEEWEAAGVVLSENKRWDDLWQLAQAAPAIWSLRLLRHLQEAGWTPQDERNQAAFGELTQCMAACREDPPFLGRLMKSADPLEGHTESVSSFAISRDGLLLASGSHDRTVRVWNLAQGVPDKTLTGHTDWVDCLALSPHERFLASGSWDNTACLWSWPEGAALQRLLGHSGEIRCLAFGAKGTVLATGSSDTTLRLWSVPDGRPLARLDGHSDVISCLAASPDGQWLASGSYDNDVRLWALPGGRPVATLRGHKAMVNCLTFSRDSRTLVSGSKDRCLLIWSLPLGTKLRRLKGHRDDISCLAVDPESHVLATGSWDTTIRLWRLLDGELLDTLGAPGTNDGHSSWVSCLAFSPDGKVLASGGFDHHVRLWSIPGGAPLKTLEGHDDRVTCLCFSPDGQTLVTGGADRAIRVWRSELARLCRLPIGQTTLEDLEWAESVLANSRLSEAERGWVRFVFGLMRSRRRFDIQVGEAARISVGEFDIEIEG